MGINKVQYGNTTLIDLTADTVTADKLMQGYTAHDRSGALITGTATGGSGDGYVWQDQDGYVHLSDEQGTSVTVEALSVTQNGTYTAPTGKAYSPVSVSVPTGGSEIVLLGADEVTVSTTSTTITTEKTCSIAVDSKVAGGLVICLIQDKAGERNGYFCSSVSVNYSNTGLRNWTKRITSTGSKGIQSAGYGVYASTMSYSGGFLTATISSRYNSTNSLTVDGTYSIKFYYIDIDAL